jgi:predicted small secreted protein
MAAPDRDSSNFWASGDPMKTLLALVMSSFFVVVVGCNTVAGAGKDIEQGGEKIQDTAKDVQQKM